MSNNSEAMDLRIDDLPVQDVVDEPADALRGGMAAGDMGDSAIPTLIIADLFTSSWRDT